MSNDSIPFAFDKEDILQIEKMGKAEFNPDDFLHIDSIKYKDKISSLTKILPERLGFSYFTVCLHFSAGARFFLSNDPAGITIPYYVTPLGKIDTLFLPEYHESEDHFFPDEETNSLKYVSTLLSRRIYGLYPGYVLIREANECLIFISAAHSEAISAPRELYRNTIDEFENFIVNFLDHTVSIIQTHKPYFRYLHFFTDPCYRRIVIKNRKRTHHYLELSQKHIGCLQLAAFGKTAHDISLELCLSPKTVPTYFRRIQQKLEVKSMTHAVTKAIKLGLITASGA